MTRPALRPLGSAVLAVLLLAAPAAGQVRGELAAGGGVTFRSGEALGSYVSGPHVQVEAGLGHGAGWRLAGVGRWSPMEHVSDLSAMHADLWTVAVELRRSFRVPITGVRPYLGIRAGSASVDYEDLPVAVTGDTFVTEEDRGALLGALVGGRLPLGRHLALDAGATLSYLDLLPVARRSLEAPGWSRQLALTVSVVGRW